MDTDPGPGPRRPQGIEAFLDHENHPARHGMHLVRDFGPLKGTPRAGRVACVGPGTRYAPARGRGRIGRMNGFSAGLVAVVAVVAVGHKGAAA